MAILQGYWRLRCEEEIIHITLSLLEEIWGKNEINNWKKQNAVLAGSFLIQKTLSSPNPLVEHKRQGCAAYTINWECGREPKHFAYENS